jgi:hypothetical protein
MCFNVGTPIVLVKLVRPFEFVLPDLIVALYPRFDHGLCMLVLNGLPAGNGNQSAPQRVIASLLQKTKSPEQRALGMGRDWLERARSVSVGCVWGCCAVS